MIGLVLVEGERTLANGFSKARCLVCDGFISHGARRLWLGEHAEGTSDPVSGCLARNDAGKRVVSDAWSGKRKGQW
jgi:hypothetical protein